MGGHSVEEISKEVRIYMTVFASLLVLSGVTVGASLLDVSTTVAIIIGLAIASIKGTLVACYFMHLISERKAIYAILALTAFFFAVLMALPAMDLQGNEAFSGRV